MSHMSNGYRVFIVHADNTVESISKKNFDDFLSRRKPVLARFAGCDIHFALVFYTLRSRRPEQIIRIDNMRLTVNGDGTLNDDRSYDAMRLSMKCESPKAVTGAASENVVDATAKFDARRWAQYNPQLAGPALKRILQALFGKPGV